MYWSTSRSTVDKYIGHYVGQHLVDSWPICWRHSVAIVYQSIVSRYFADRSSTYHRHLADVMADDHHRYLTDPWSTIHRYVADTLPMLSRRTVGWSGDRYETDRKTPLDRDIGRYLADTRPTLDRHLGWELTECQSMYRSICRSTLNPPKATWSEKSLFHSATRHNIKII